MSRNQVWTLKRSMMFDWKTETFNEIFFFYTSINLLRSTSAAFVVFFLRLQFAFSNMCRFSAGTSQPASIHFILWWGSSTAGLQHNREKKQTTYFPFSREKKLYLFLFGKVFLKCCYNESSSVLFLYLNRFHPEQTVLKRVSLVIWCFIMETMLLYFQPLYWLDQSVMSILELSIWVQFIPF